MDGDFASSDAAATVRATGVYDFFVKMKGASLQRRQGIQFIDQINHFILTCPQGVIR
jgi:hypothetical protein